MRGWGAGGAGGAGLGSRPLRLPPRPSAHLSPTPSNCTPGGIQCAHSLEGKEGPGEWGSGEVRGQGLEGTG